MANEPFGLNVRTFCEKAKDNMDQALRGIALEILSQIVLKTPVGNPELWAANADVMHKRATFNDESARTNSLLDAHPEFALKYGKLKRQRSISARTIAKRLPLNSGAGYTGGRARGNWFVGIGRASSETTDAVDPSGAGSIGRGAAVIANASLGWTLYITNNLPYALRLEMGWSAQAPFGIVRTTVAEFQSIVSDQVKSLS
jgi:hypothetical protein